MRVDLNYDSGDEGGMIRGRGIRMRWIGMGWGDNSVMMTTLGGGGG